MKRYLIVDTGIDFIDRKQITYGDAIIVFSPEGEKHIAAPWGDPCHADYWQIMNLRTRKKIAWASSFIGFFEGENKEKLKGWKFYKLE